MGGTRDVEPGSVFGAYEIDSVVGRGTNAVVYLARHQLDDTWHALKLLRRIDSRRRIRLEQEAIVRDELRHPNIVPATECVEVGDEVALISEFVEGPSLSTWMRESSPRLQDRLAIFQGVLTGVAHAHAHQVVHRDLKPSNVLLQPGPDQTWIPRISDFGLAKALSPEVGRFGGLTTVNTSLGTPGYAAPEQARDASAVDHRADLYSLGCLLYEMICGVAPFAGRSAFDTLAAQRDERFPPPEKVAPGLPDDLYALIRELLRTDPSARPASCDLVIRRIEAVYQLHLAGTPQPSAPPPPQPVGPPLSPPPAPPPLTVGAPAPSRADMPTDGDEDVPLGPVLTLCAIPLLGLVLGAGFVLGFAP